MPFLGKIQSSACARGARREMGEREKERGREREKIREVNMRVRVKISESGYPVFPASLFNAKNSRPRPREHMSEIRADLAVRIETGDLR